MLESKAKRRNMQQQEQTPHKLKVLPTKAHVCHVGYSVIRYLCREDDIAMFAMTVDVLLISS